MLFIRATVPVLHLVCEIEFYTFQFVAQRAGRILQLSNLLGCVGTRLLNGFSHAETLLLQLLAQPLHHRTKLVVLGVELNDGSLDRFLLLVTHPF